MSKNKSDKRFAVYPSVALKDIVDPKAKPKKLKIVKQLLFGDYILPYKKDGAYITVTVTEKKKKVTYIKVRSRNKDGYIKEDQMQEDRVLEVNFIDVGQGDGCHIATPEDKHFLIDAGASDNMYRFLKWRFNLRNAKNPPPPFTVVISHSDADHYGGFSKIFSVSKGTKQQFSITKIYHNGLVEFSGEGVDTLGTVIPVKKQKDYITDLCDSDSDFKKRIKKAGKPGQYISTLLKSSAKKESLRLGSDPLYKSANMKIEVLGPVAKKINRKDALPVFEGNKGKTKNGHSVILKATIGHLRLLLGGDLNVPAEDYILSHYTGQDIKAIKTALKDDTLSIKKRQALEKELEDVIITARQTFGVDIAKSCHHGSADFTTEFLKALNPIATVISSGDDEPHTHPRPDTLGTIGKHSRGKRSLIFCTELARSSKEFVDLTKSRAKTENKKERVVIVYGMINVRTDGEKVVLAQKLERQKAGQNWDIHVLEWNAYIKQFEYKQYVKYEK